VEEQDELWLCITNLLVTYRAINILSSQCRDMLHKARPPAKLRNRLPGRTPASIKRESASRHTQPKSARSLSDPEDAASEFQAAYESGSGSEGASDDGFDLASDEDHDADADAPRVVQWVDIDSEAGSQTGEETDDTNVISSAQPSRDLVRSRVSLSLMQTY
jgi:ribosomal RNA-processing protein 36